MRDPVKIKDLAYRMIRHSGLIPEIDITIEYAGLRPGEKMYEELLTDLEDSQKTEHEKIYVVYYKAAPCSLTDSDIKDFEKDILVKTNKEIRELLQRFIKSYTPVSPID